MHNKKLSEFYFLCKEKYSSLEEWILQNKFIVNSQVSCNSPTFSGYTPLHFAVKINNLGAVKILLRNNADFTIKNTNGQTPLHLGMEMILFNKNKFSRWEKNLQLILDEILLAHNNNNTNLIDSINNAGLTHFHIACYRDIEVVILNFLKNGVDFDSCIKSDSQYWPGYTALHIATKYSYFHTASLLLKYGASINIKNASGLTPFHCSLKKGDGLFIQLFQSVLKQNDIVTIVDDEKSSLLHVSCMAIDELYTLNKLLENNKNVFISVFSKSPLWGGYTPLHAAIYYKRMYLASILVQHGADINAKDVNQTSPFQLAIRKQLISKSFMSLILSKFFRVAELSDYDLRFYNLVSACVTQDYKLMKRSLDEGFDVNYCVPSNYPINLPGYTLLHFATEQRDMKIIDLLLDRGASICCQDSAGSSPLHLASQNTNLLAIEKMLSFYSKNYVNPINNDGLSHLHIASLYNKTEIVKSLLKHKDMVNLATKTGETILHYAVKSNALETVILLLNNGADFTAQDTVHGLTPLHLAVEKKNPEIVDVILSYHGGRIVNPVSKAGLSHFHILCMKNQVNLVQNFVKKIDVTRDPTVSPDSKKFGGFTALHFAVKFGSTETLKILLDLKFDVFSEDALHKVPLHYIGKLNSPAMQKILDAFWQVTYKIGRNIINRYNISALHVACMRDDHLSVVNLFRCGYTVDDLTTLDCPLWPGYSPLHFAVKYGSLKTTEVLLNNAASANARDRHGLTPLHLGCSRDPEVVEKLLSSGADPTMRSLSGITPLRLAVQSGNGDVVRMIMSHSTSRIENPMDNKGLTYFHIACLRNSVDLVEMYALNGVDVNEQVHLFAPKFPGCTPLHVAVRKRFTEMIGVLLRHGANANVPDANGNTPLHLTCLPKVGWLKLARKLMKHGGSPNVGNAFGETLVELGIKYNHLKILREALKHGGDPNVNNCRPLVMAVSLHREHMMDQLLANGADVGFRFPDGKTFFHQTILNVQADETYYFRVFLRLLEHGCDPNARDDTGRAALHNSYWPVNMPGLKALLRCGADVDAEDLSGRTVVSYFLEITTSRMPRTELYRIFRKHLEARKRLGFALSQTNEALYNTLVEHAEDFLYTEEDDGGFAEELRKMKDMHFGAQPSLYDMVKSVNVMAKHLARNGSLRELFKSKRFADTFPCCGCVVMMQYEKALKRSKLMRAAIEVLCRKLGWNLECSEALVEYLGDDDLRSLGEIQ